MKQQTNNPLCKDFPIKIKGFYAIQALLANWRSYVGCLYVGNQNSRSVQLIEQAKLADIKVDTSANSTYITIQHLPVLAEQDLQEQFSSDKINKILILDGVTDTRNLGACIRSANAFGIDAIVLAKNNSAAITDATYHASSGALVFTPVFRVNNLVSTIKWLKTQATHVIGTVCSSEGEAVQQATVASKLAIVMGSEDKGIAKQTKLACHQLVYIPMSGAVGSLNVSVATGVVLYQILQMNDVQAKAY